MSVVAGFMAGWSTFMLTVIAFKLKRIADVAERANADVLTRMDAAQDYRRKERGL